MSGHAPFAARYGRLLAGSAADRGGGRGGIGTIFAGDRRRAVHDATPDGSASGISRDRLDGIRYLGYSRDAGPMTGPWGDQCADMRGAFHVPPPFMLRSPPRYSGARRPVPRVLILDSSLRVGLGRRREAESHLSSSPSWRGTLRLAKPMHRDNLPRREMSHTHTHTGATWTCVPVGVTRGGSHATFASRAAARVGRLRRGALRLAVLGALLLVPHPPTLSRDEIYS